MGESGERRSGCEEEGIAKDRLGEGAATRVGREVELESV